MMGFDRDEVNSFLEMVANEFEQIIKQYDELSAKVKLLQERIDGYEKIEKILNETLITAQRATDEAKLNAQKEAELILKDAQFRAGKYEDQSRQNVYKLESDLMSLKTQRDGFLARFKSMLRDQLALVDVISESIKDKEGGEIGSRGKTAPKAARAAFMMRNSALEEDETMDEVPPQPVV